MLSQFNRIKKIGLFDDYTHQDECCIGGITLIFGENGVGKSTLAAILDSLRESSPSSILKRRTLPGDAAPEATVMLGDKEYVFRDGAWCEQPPYDTLDVFYPGFITRNVHTATEIDTSHKRNLCEVVLGRAAIQKIAELEQADQSGRAALKDIGTVEAQIKLLIKEPDTLDIFLGLSADSEVDSKIEAVRQELKEAQSKDALLARPVPRKVDLPELSRSLVEQYLQRTAEGVGEDVASRVAEHISNRLDGSGEKWLAYGVKHLSEGRQCPFCDQGTEGVDLVDVLLSYFSPEYQGLVEGLTEASTHLRKQLGESAFASIRAAASQQINIVSQWLDKDDGTVLVLTEQLGKAEESWGRGAAQIESLIAKKTSNPLGVPEGAPVDSAVKCYDDALSLLGGVNEAVESVGRTAAAHKEKLTRADAGEIEKRLNRLLNQKARGEKRVQDLLTKRNELLATRESVVKTKAQLKKDIDDHAASVVGKYQDGINHYLSHLGCDIQIASVDAKYPSGKASVQYKLKVRGHEIELGVSDESPSFETVLSDGDKCALALAFFFARLRDCSDLNGRTIVLDDPVNSLGGSRRGLVEGVIRDLAERGAQVVVLTHDERLAAMMWRDTRLKDIVTLQVERTASGSGLKAWDIESATRSAYVRHFLSLEEYLATGGDHEKVAGCIRPYVEQRLRHLFPGPPFQTRDSLGVMIRKIRECPEGSRLHAARDKLPELVAINDASLPSHHATDDVAGMEPLTPDGVRMFAERALAVI